MKDLKREIVLMAGIIVLSVIAVTTLGISKISSSLNVSSAAETEEDIEELVFSQTVSSLKAGSKSRFAVTGGGEEIMVRIGQEMCCYKPGRGIAGQKGRQGNCLCQKCK